MAHRYSSLSSLGSSSPLYFLAHLATSSSATVSIGFTTASPLSGRSISVFIVRLNLSHSSPSLATANTLNRAVIWETEALRNCLAPVQMSTPVCKNIAISVESNARVCRFGKLSYLPVSSYNKNCKNIPLLFLRAVRRMSSLASLLFRCVTDTPKL